MPLLDRPDSYGALSRLNHWLSAALIIALLAIGMYFHDLPQGEQRLNGVRLHLALGTLAVVPLLWRVAWRVIVSTPAPVPQASALQVLATSVHGLLLLGILVMAVSGPLQVWAAGNPLQVFDWFSLPGPALLQHPELEQFLGGVHRVVSRVLMLLIGLHLLGTLKHAITGPETILARMLGRGQG